MKLGPVLSQTHNLVTETHLPEENSYWQKLFRDTRFKPIASANLEYKELMAA